METRLVIAYVLIGLMLATGAWFVRLAWLRRRDERRIRRGYTPVKRGAWRPADRPLTPP